MVFRLGLNTDYLTHLHNENPKTAFIFIFHTTDDSNFRGQQDFAHDVDVIIKVGNATIRANGRFGVGNKTEVIGSDCNMNLIPVSSM